MERIPGRDIPRQRILSPANGFTGSVFARFAHRGVDPIVCPRSPRGEAYEKCKTFFSELGKELPDSEENLSFLGACGWKFLDYNEFTEAEAAFEHEMQMADRRHDQARLGDALEGKGAIYREKGDFPKAEQVLEQARIIDEKLGDKYVLSRLYNSMARLLGAENKEGGYEYLQRSLKLAQEINNPLRIAVASNNIGTYFKGQGDAAHALEYFQQSLTALQQINEELKSATVLDNIGLSYSYLGDYPRAIESIQQGLKIREKYGDPEQTGKSWDSLGIMYLGQGNYAAALVALQKGLKLRSVNKLPRSMANSLNNISLVYEAEGEHTQSIVYLKKSLAVARKVGDIAMEALIDINLGESYLQLGNYPRALATLKEGLVNARSANDKIEAAGLQSTLGRVYLTQGRLPEAENMFNEARTFYEAEGIIATLGDTLIDLAEVERQQGHINQSFELASRARDLGDRMGSPELQRRSLTTLGHLNAAQGRREEAVKSFEAAISAVEDLRTRVAGGEENRSRFFAGRIEPYQERIGLALADGKTDDALYYAERTKARVLVDVISSDRVPLDTVMSDDERSRETGLRSALASLNNQIINASQSTPLDEKRLASIKQQCDEARLQYEDFESTLYSAHPELVLSRGAVPAVSTVESKELLPSRSAAIVEYAVVRQRIWVFVITAQGVQAFKLTLSNNALKQQVERFRQQLAARDLRISDTAQQLYKNVLGPAHTLLKDKDELIIIPDGMLWNLPFQALQSRPNRYLIENTAISYAPSLTALREMMKPHPQTNNQPTLLAFGNPLIGDSVAPRRKLSLMDEHLSPLPEAEVQVKSIGQIYSPDSRVYIGREAREDRWKSEANHYRILHLATHGVLDDRSPMYSYLVLTPAAHSQNSEDGLLEAWEIMRMHLNADLVVLSACETAQGKVSAGEAVIGLTWAFFVAGSPATLVTQWKVESASSGDLMTDFHKRWKGGRSGLSKARSLQLAAVQMLHSRNYSHPFYWAGYILVGNGR